MILHNRYNILHHATSANKQETSGNEENCICANYSLCVEIMYMPDKVVQQIVTQGSLLGKDGQELKKGIWETCVYLGKNDFVYYLTAESLRGELKVRIAGKRTIGEYLRWVDGLFRPGDLPSGENAIHYRAARKLRELI